MGLKVGSGSGSRGMLNGDGVWERISGKCGDVFVLKLHCAADQEWRAENPSGRWELGK